MLLIPVIFLLALVFLPQWWVRFIMHKHGGDVACLPGTGREFAEYIRDKYELPIKIEETELGDHYDPIMKTVRLNRLHFHKKSLTAIAIAAHEMGHALQHHLHDSRLTWRTRLVSFSGKIEKIALIAMLSSPIVGLISQSPRLTLLIFVISYLGIINTVMIQLITLPVEWDASFNKALPLLHETHQFPVKDMQAMNAVLLAAALTYVAASLSSLLNFFRWFRSGRPI